VPTVVADEALEGGDLVVIFYIDVGKSVEITYVPPHPGPLPPGEREKNHGLWFAAC